MEPPFAPLVALASFGATISAPASVVFGDDGIRQFLASSAVGFDPIALKAPAKYLERDIRKLNDGTLRLRYEAESAVGGDALKLQQIWTPPTDGGQGSIENKKRKAATVCYSDFRGMWDALVEFYARIRLELG